MPKVVDRDQRRTELTMALWQVIYEDGIDGVSFRSVARAAGVSVGRVQHYFPSKDEMVLHGCRQMVAAAVAEHGPDQDPGDPHAAREGLTALLCSTVSDGEEFRIGAGVWAAYQAKAVSSPDIAAVVTEALTGRTHALAALLAAARAGRSGESSSPTAADRLDALRLGALSEGITQRVLVGAMRADEARKFLRSEVDRGLGG
jgi:TetR/AcrR family transcriptional regulator, transcriptional repressor of bet genes